MVSLRMFHLVFVLIVIVAADMFGAWGIYAHATRGEPGTLVVGILSFVFGFGMIGYALWLVRKFERARIE